jgi:hypothetical protein
MTTRLKFKKFLPLFIVLCKESVRFFITESEISLNFIYHCIPAKKHNFHAFIMGGPKTAPDGQPWGGRDDSIVKCTQPRALNNIQH